VECTVHLGIHVVEACIYSFPAIWALFARAAAKSICPGAPGGRTTPPLGFVALPADGRGALGTGGFAPAGGGIPGFAPGAGGFGLAPGAGGGAGLLPITLDGRELSSDAAGDFFHGVAEPLDGAIPGKTDTGLADAFAVSD
jgi:hypothetical protein